MNGALVLQTDFGSCDGAVCAMHGVAYSVDKNLIVSDLTHEIPQYNIWEASYRLLQVLSYWPLGSVFVSVVDPGVGTDRRSLAVETKTGQYIITPDNGTLTHVKKKIGIQSARVINERKNRLTDSGKGHTFCGRDLYVYTGARLAAGLIAFSELGNLVPQESIFTLDTGKEVFDGEYAKGIIDVLDVRFGSLWTSISSDTFLNLDVKYGEHVEVIIKNGITAVYRNVVAFSKSFADVCKGEPLVYINSIGNIGIAVNQGSFAGKYNIGSGVDWTIAIRKRSIL